MEQHGISWWEPPFEGMCYMYGMCFDMLTPMLYMESYVARASPMSQW